MFAGSTITQSALGAALQVSERLLVIYITHWTTLIIRERFFSTVINTEQLDPNNIIRKHYPNRMPYIGNVAYSTIRALDSTSPLYNTYMYTAQ